MDDVAFVGCYLLLWFCLSLLLNFLHCGGALLWPLIHHFCLPPSKYGLLDFFSFLNLFYLCIPHGYLMRYGVEPVEWLLVRLNIKDGYYHTSNIFVT